MIKPMQVNKTKKDINERMILFKKNDKKRKLIL
jgi:hypothetical protein